jgi:hypothetical protein
MKKFLCKCKKIATWEFVPSSTNKRNPYYCEECVPRGCICNTEYVPNSTDAQENGFGELPDTVMPWRWIIKDKSWCYTDSQGRDFPCIEYWENKHGFEADESIINDYKSKYIEYYVE